jgi:hypothetical protein
MYSRVSPAGVRVTQEHGLVDCGPRRFEPDADVRDLVELGRCGKPDHQQNDARPADARPEQNN